jgi:adenosine kinase
VGKDGAEYLKYLKKMGISSKYIKEDKSRLTASAFITTDADDNQITAFFNGPLGLANEVLASALKKKVSLALISPTEKDTMIKHMLDCRERGIKTVFDPGQQITAFSEVELKKMISAAYFVIGNDYEIKLLQDRTGWDAKEILKNTKVLITTLGEHGSVVSTAEGEVIETSSCPPKSFDDPTGAGDAYRAGFFVSYELGYGWRICAQMGGVAASYAIETYGTQKHDFTLEDFCARYFKVFGEKINLTI